MAGYEKRDMTGTLFRNERKESDNHPDWAGYIIINGVEYWLNCWEKHGAKGLFFSLAAKPKQERAAEIKQAAKPRYGDPGTPPAASNDDDSEIPF
jgi:hypothetical protein